MPDYTLDPPGPPRGIDHGASNGPFIRDAGALSESGAPEPYGPPRLKPGEVLSERFVIDRLAGSGGMGAVYRALDRITGDPVALKVARRGPHEERFAREARVLADLDHPAIVRYVAHGETAQGQPYLAMEWLHGEDLAQRLAVSRLTVAESLDVVRRAAEGLAAAHERGLVHRDVKPSNVMLVDGKPARAKLVDFGIVGMELTDMPLTAPPMTRTGVVMGTVGYMSPEQATGERKLDARTDVFALGCVLFECLIGEPVFTGDQVVAVLAKVLREEARRVRSLRPDLPQALDALVARMLSKDRALRPQDGGVVVSELRALGDVAGGVPVAATRAPETLSGGEQRMMSVMLAEAPDDPGRVSEVVRRHGGDLARLANGALLVTLGGRGATSEQVVIAAACALDLQQALPTARIALATGRAVTTAAGGAPGPVIDQAAGLLAQLRTAGIRVDEVTVGLLGERFDVRTDGREHTLLGLRADLDLPRTLLGKPTPCVGRDKELGLLEGTLRECVGDSVARAVVVTGPAGQGKSRLRREFERKARELGRGLSILVARSDPMGAGSALMIGRQLVRRAAGLRQGDPPGRQYGKLRAHVAGLCDGASVTRVSQFLGELVGVETDEAPSPQLRAARNDPRIMGEWLRRSFCDWLAGECTARPMLLVLEDLHWGDLPSITYVGEALQRLADRPLMVLALARPEVHDAFPNLWANVERQDIALGRLTARAAERLVRAALGSDLPAEIATRLITRADGNAFYLEELIRRESEGGGDAVPETVLALAQLRLERLEPPARRIVRAASVFGEVFWRGGVVELLGAEHADDVERALQGLAEREVFATAVESRFAHEREFTFRHGLLRQAAYAMLTDSDRTRGHKLAGQWLERAGERDAVMMASHFEAGGEPARAVPWLLSAVQTAIDGGNTKGAIALGHRGIDCGPNDVDRGLIRMLQGQALALRGEWAEAVETGREALPLLPAGSTQWFLCAAGLLLGGVFLGDASVTAPVLQSILEVSVPPEPSGPYGLAVVCACMGLSWMGQLDLAGSFLAQPEATEAKSHDVDPSFALMLRVSRAFLELMSGELGPAIDRLGEVRALADRTGDAWGRVVAILQMVHALSESGAHDRTVIAARELAMFCEPIGLRYSDWGTYHVARSNINAGRPAEAAATLRHLMGQFDPMMSIFSRCLLAHALIATGDLDRAEVEARATLEVGGMFPHGQACAFAALAVVERTRGRAAEALALCVQGLEAASRGGFHHDVSILRLERARALEALGRTDEARVAIREARDRLMTIAASFRDTELHRAYLADIGANAETLTHFSRLGG